MKLNIPPLKTEMSLFRNDHKPCIQIALLMKNYTRKRSVTTVRVVLTPSSTGFGTEGGVRSTSNKTARLGKISKGVNLRNKGTGYKNIA